MSRGVLTRLASCLLLDCSTERGKMEEAEESSDGLESSRYLAFTGGGISDPLKQIKQSANIFQPFFVEEKVWTASARPQNPNTAYTALSNTMNY